VFTSFAIVSITGPVAGIIIGGNVTTYLGGYYSKKALYSAMAISILCACTAIPIPFLNSFYLTIVLLWFLLFFGGSVLPCLTGIMLNTVGQDQKTCANSIANVSYNLLGFLPSPFIYGAVHDAGEGGNARLALGMLMFMTVPCVVIIFTVGHIIKRDNILGYRKDSDTK
jgi:MFS transporter, Spinster family, sphingosine-1-phosphate transporter